MEPWQTDLLHHPLDDATSLPQAFARIEQAAQTLGFDYVSYCHQASLPASNPRVTLVNNYPEDWRSHNADAGHFLNEAQIRSRMQSSLPILWTDEVFARNPDVQQSAREHGICHGWTQVFGDSPAGTAFLSLVRRHPALSPHELEAKRDRLNWLAHMAHTLLSRLILQQQVQRDRPLSEREIEVLKWTADGKSAQDIAEILLLSKNTVDFHIKNSIRKLNVPNKTAAVVRAVLMGMIH